MITQEELKAGLDLVNNDGVFNIHHPKIGSGAIIRVKNDIVLGMGALAIFCDDLRLRGGVLEFMKNGEVVTALDTEFIIVDNTEQ